MKPAWIDLRRGDPVYDSSGARAGEVIHSTPDQVIVQLDAYRGPTFLRGKHLGGSVSRLGASLTIFTTPR
jgi:hypothetical protein